MTDSALDSKVRRTAKRAGLYACKSHDRSLHINNLGGYMLIDERTAAVVNGVNFDLTADDVLTFCADRAVSKAAVSPAPTFEGGVCHG